MRTLASDWITFPVVGLLVGLLLVKSQSMIVSTDVKWVYVLVFGVLGLTLAGIRKSALLGKYNSWLQGMFWISATTFCLVFLFWDVSIREEINLPEYLQQELESTGNLTAHTSHELQFVRFAYSDEFELFTNSVDEVVLRSLDKVPWGTEERSERVYLIFESETDVSDFDIFANQHARKVHGDAEDFGLEEEPTVVGSGTDKLWFLTSSSTVPHYEIQTDEINDMPVIVEQRNFAAMCGNVLEVIFWLGDGRLAHFYSDCSNKAEYPDLYEVEEINQILSSFEKI